MKLAALILALGCLASADTVLGQTTLTIPNTTKVANPTRPGVNVGGNTEYWPLQMTKSLNAANNGYMVPGYFQSSFLCSSGGTNSTTQAWSNAGGSYPANYFVGATIVIYNSSNGAQYGSSTITASSAQSGSGIQFTFSPAISFTPNSGCQPSFDTMMVKFVNAPLTASATPQFQFPSCSGAAWNYTDFSPASPNQKQSLQLPTGCFANFTMDQGVNNLTNTNPTLQTTSVGYININGSYTATFKAKCLTAGCSVTFSLGRASGATFISSTTVNPTFNTSPGVGWQTYTYSFTGSEVGTHGPGVLYFFSNTGTALVQDMDVIEGSTLSGNTTAFRDAVVRKLQAIHPGSLRFMDGADWCSDVNDMIQPIGQNRWCSFNTSNDYTFNPPVNYQSKLGLCYFLQADCWLTIGQFNLPSDWTQLINWLANTSDGPSSGVSWNAALASIGHRIYLEEGNEAWNFGVMGGLFASDGLVYGAVMAPNAAAAHAASGWNSTVDEFVGDGWSAPGQCGTNGTTNGWCYTVLLQANAYKTAHSGSAPFPDFMNGAYYMFPNFGTFSTSGANLSPTAGSPFLDEVAEITNINSLTSPISGYPSMNIATSYLKGNQFGVPVGSSVYEANYGTGTGVAATQLQLNQFAGSVGEGLFSLENYMLMQRDAQTTGPINIFNFGTNSEGYTCSGGGCSANASMPIYGVVRNAACGPGQLSTCTDTDRPISIAAQVFNSAIASVGTSDNLISTTQSGTPTFSYTANSNGIAANSSVPYVQCATYANPSQTNWATVCFNNNLTTAETVTLTGSGAPTGSVTQTIFPNSGNLITDNNENTYIGPSSIAASVTVPSSTSTSGTTYSIPPASMITLTYTIGGTPRAATPVFSPAPGSYTSITTVTVTDSTPGASTFCTTNGTTPTTSSPPYTAPFTVSSTETIQCIATAPGYLQSLVGGGLYTIAFPPAATPTFSPTPGTYSASQNVTINDATAGATIYYTTDGSTPTTSSAVFTSPILVSATTTIKAIATAPSSSQSAVGTGTYTISIPTVATPTFCTASMSCGGGTYVGAQTITIASTTLGAAVYYTRDGTTPTFPVTGTTTLYTAPLTVAGTMTLKAIGVLTGSVNSPVGSASYVINGPVIILYNGNSFTSGSSLNSNP